MTAPPGSTVTGCRPDPGTDDAGTDEAGTAPGDRPFRPDVEGLRAVAVVLVVLYHGGVSTLRGGYVGVDVFFVISGFVITGVLLRERSSTGRTSFPSFYGRRSRRIIPAATLVIVGTVVVAYWRLGAVFGDPTAVDARWVAVFLGNFHFASAGTDYLDQHQPPSALLNFWSLAVEEQFYLVFPALFALAAGLRTRWTLHARLAVGLSATIVCSLALSIAQTGSDPTAAYFSPFTRAWELALGALIAVCTGWLLRLPRALAATMTWVGLAAIGIAAVAFSGLTAYPGWLVTVPVLGTGLVIAGGAVVPRSGAEVILGLRPLRWTGRLSYSLYLWHWPLLVIAADAAGQTHLPFRQNIIPLFLALAAAFLTYRFVELPVRHAPTMGPGWRPVALGGLLIALSLVVATVYLHVDGGGVVRPARSAALASVEHLVAGAPSITTLPSDLTPSLASVPLDWGGPSAACSPSYAQTSLPSSCVFGDTRAARTMIVYGDSHAGMWFEALDAIAIASHWRLVDLWKAACHVGALTYANPVGVGRPGAPFAACSQWQRFAVSRINRIDPSLLILTQDVGSPAVTGENHAAYFTPRQWQQGLTDALGRIHVPMRQVVVLGNIPALSQSGPTCLARHPTNVQACTRSAHTALARYDAADRAAARASGARYIDVTPWFCSSVCTAIIGHFEVYFDVAHVTATYSLVLQRVLGQALDMPTGR